MSNALAFVFVTFACGVAWRLGNALGLILLSQGFRGLIGRDRSDGPRERSGLMVLRDHGTGREYLMSPTGHIVPRAETNGEFEKKMRTER